MLTVILRFFLHFNEKAGLRRVNNELFSLTVIMMHHVIKGDQIKADPLKSQTYWHTDPIPTMKPSMILDPGQLADPWRPVL